MGSNDVVRSLERNARVTARIEADFDRIDPHWRETDEGEDIPRVCYGHGVMYGEIRCDVSGSGDTDETRPRFVAAIVSAIQAKG